MHLELTSFMMKAVMEIFFSSSKLLMKVLFYAFFQFTLVCHYFLQVTTTNIFIKYPDSLIIVSHLSNILLILNWNFESPVKLGNLVTFSCVSIESQ